MKRVFCIILLSTGLLGAASITHASTPDSDINDSHRIDGGAGSDVIVVNNHKN